MDDMTTLPADWTVEQRLTHAIGYLPTVLHNRLSDGSRGPLVQALLSSIDEVGLELVVKRQDA